MNRIAKIPDAELFPEAGAEPPIMDADEASAFSAAVKQGLAELDAGLYVCGKDVDAWARSLFTADELPPPPVRQRERRRG